MTNMADIERNMGRDEEAQKLYAETLQLEERVLGPDQRETAVTKYDLACLLAKRGQADEAFALLTHAVDHGLPPRMALDIEKWTPTPFASSRSPLCGFGQARQAAGCRAKLGLAGATGLPQ